MVEKSNFSIGREITWGGPHGPWEYPQPTLDAFRAQKLAKYRSSKNHFFNFRFCIFPIECVITSTEMAFQYKGPNWGGGVGQMITFYHKKGGGV